MKTDILEDITILAPEVRQIDTLNAEEVGRNLSESCSATNKVVLDLEGVQFIDSSGLGIILALVREMHEKGGKIALCCAGSTVQALFRMVRLSNIVSIFQSRNDALSSFTS